jgi:hypothetical protein
MLRCKPTKSTNSNGNWLIVNNWRCNDVFSNSEPKKQIKKAEEINNNSSSSISSTSLSYETHSDVIYTSRLLNFKNLPEPINSDDYYEQDDNIMSINYSGIN